MEQSLLQTMAVLTRLLPIAVGKTLSQNCCLCHNSRWYRQINLADILTTIYMYIIICYTTPVSTIADLYILSPRAISPRMWCV